MLVQVVKIIKKENNNNVNNAKNNNNSKNEVNDNIITVNNLKKTFSTYERKEGFINALKALIIRKKKYFKAIDDVSFKIKRGEIVAFLGPNGAGKSTTIKALSGVLYPDSGEIKCYGYIPYKHRTKYVAHIGVVFGQKSQLFWDLPPIDSFYLNKSIYKIPEKEFKKNMKYLVNILKIEKIIHRPTRQLSLGERMKCEFVMAMLHNPKILFLDEPTIGLDIFAKEIVRQFIRDVNKKFNTTIIVTSHDLEDIEHLCERLIVINKGHIVFDDKLSSLNLDSDKKISITFEKKINLNYLKSLKNITIESVVNDFAVKIRTNTKTQKLGEIIKLISMNNHIEDLEVSNEPITELIKKLYVKKKK